MELQVQVSRYVLCVSTCPHASAHALTLSWWTVRLSVFVDGVTVSASVRVWGCAQRVCSARTWGCTTRGWQQRWGRRTPRTRGWNTESGRSETVGMRCFGLSRSACCTDGSMSRRPWCCQQWEVYDEGCSVILWTWVLLESLFQYQQVLCPCQRTSQFVRMCPHQPVFHRPLHEYATPSFQSLGASWSRSLRLGLKWKCW